MIIVPKEFDIVIDANEWKKPVVFPPFIVWTYARQRHVIKLKLSSMRLPTGDYTCLEPRTNAVLYDQVAVERKYDLAELKQNFGRGDRPRWARCLARLAQVPKAMLLLEHRMPNCHKLLENFDGALDSIQRECFRRGIEFCWLPRSTSATSPRTGLFIAHWLVNWWTVCHQEMEFSQLKE